MTQLKLLDNVARQCISEKPFANLQMYTGFRPCFNTDQEPSKKLEKAERKKSKNRAIIGQGQSKKRIRTSLAESTSSTGRRHFIIAI